MPDPAFAPLPEPPQPAARSQRGREIATAFTLGLLGAGVLMRGVWAAPSRRLLGDWQQPDVLSSHWVADWMARRLAGFGGILHSGALSAPVGETPLGTLGGAATAFCAPLLAVLGWPLGMNVYIALLCAANVAAGAMLARAAGASRWATLIGALGFGLSPYLLTEVSAGRFTQVPAWELAAALALWIGHLERPDRRKGLIAAGLFGLASLEYAWYGMLAGLAAGCLAIAAAYTDRTRLRDRAWVREVALSGVASVLASAPAIALVVTALPVAAQPKVPEPLSLEYSLPPAWPLSTEGGPLVPAAVSWVLVALAVAGLVSARRDARRWVTNGLAAVVVLGWGLSLGPRMLTPGGPVLDSHFPFYVLYSLVFPRFLYPYQHVLLVTLGVAALAAVGVSRLAARLPRGTEAILVAAFVVAVPVELHLRGVALAPKVSHLAPEPPWLGELRALPEGTLIGLPLAPELRVSQEVLLLQMLHNHPMVDSRTAWLDDQRPAAWDTWVGESGFLKELERFERGREVPGDPTRANYFRYPVEDVGRVVGQGVRWVMVWDTLYGEPIKGLARAEKRLLTELCGPPVLTAEGLAVFDLAAHHGTGDLAAPLWRMPEGVHTGDGIHRMAGLMPPGVLFERAN